MRITTVEEFDQKSEVLVLGLFENDNLKKYSVELDKEISEFIKKNILSSKFGEMYGTKVKDWNYRTVIVLGLGKKEELTLEKVRRAMGKLVKCVKSLKAESVCTTIVEEFNQAKLFDGKNLGNAVAEGLVLADYEFVKYLSKEKLEKKKSINTISLMLNKDASEDFVKGLKIGRTIAEATNFAKDLVNEPASVCIPSYIEKIAQKIAADNKKIKIKVMNEEDLKREGLNVFLGVSRGSPVPPKFIFLEYNNSIGEKVAIIGKGITFDSGGYNLKMTGYIEDMKSDMAGAAAVLATIKLAAELDLKRNILGVIPLCENMISGSAQKPGDIVKAYNGKTIEIRNTDAEGRLILADALAYTEAKYKPAIMIDLATLTGACVIALGYYASGILGKDKGLIKSLVVAGEKSGDRVWELPFYEDYHDAMDGTISDLRNTSGKGKGYEGGAIIGAVFLSKFVDKAKWAHIDMAGPAFVIEESDYLQKGGTGAGVRLLGYYFMRD